MKSIQIRSYNRLRPIHFVQTLAVCATLMFCATTARIHAAVAISPDIEYFYSDGPGEGLSVSPNGKFIMVSSPVALNAAATLFSSSVPHIVHTPLAPEPFNLIHTFNLSAYGECTDVGVPYHGRFGLTVVRADLDSPFNGMLAICGNKVVQEIAIPERPDGMKISPDGKYAIVAVEKGGEIRIYDLDGGAGQIRLAAIVTKAALAAWYVGVPNPVDALEPEAVGISSDSSFAIITIQDSSSVASVSLDAVTLGQQQGLSPETIGDIALRKVLHLPFGFIGNNGLLFGVEPDGVGISPDGSFAILAHEANNRAKHLQGFSVIDLRNGLENISAQTHYIFNIDSTLLANTGLAAAPVPVVGAPYPAAATRLPRLDPASVEIVSRGGQTVAALIIERYDPSAAQIAASPNNETRGSVLFLDAGEVLSGSIAKIAARAPVGASGSRIEVVDSAQGGRWVFVSISNGGGDRGTFARFELLSQ